MHDKSLVYTFAANASIDEEKKSVSFSNAAGALSAPNAASTPAAQIQAKSSVSKVKREDSDRQYGQQAKSTLFQCTLKALNLLLTMQQQQQNVTTSDDGSTKVNSEVNGVLFLNGKLDNPSVSLGHMTALVSGKLLSASRTFIQSESNRGSLGSANGSSENQNRLLLERLLSVWGDLTHSYDPQSSFVGTDGAAGSAESNQLPHETLALLVDCITLLSPSSDVSISNSNVSLYDTVLLTLCHHFPFGVSSLDLAVSRCVASWLSSASQCGIVVSQNILLCRERVVMHLVQSHFNTVPALSTPTMPEQQRKQQQDSTRISNKRKMKQSSLSLLVTHKNASSDSEDAEDTEDTDTQSDIDESNFEKNEEGRKSKKVRIATTETEKKFTLRKRGAKTSTGVIDSLCLLLQLSQFSAESTGPSLETVVDVDQPLQELRMSVLQSVVKYLSHRNDQFIVREEEKERCIALRLLYLCISHRPEVVDVRCVELLRIILRPWLSSSTSINDDVSLTVVGTLRQLLLVTPSLRDAPEMQQLMCDLFFVFSQLLLSGSSNSNIHSFVLRMIIEVCSLFPADALLKIFEGSQHNGIFYNNCCQDACLSALLASLQCDDADKCNATVPTWVSVSTAVIDNMLSISSNLIDENKYVDGERLAAKLVQFLLGAHATTGSAASSQEAENLFELFLHALSRPLMGNEANSQLSLAVSCRILVVVDQYMSTCNTSTTIDTEEVDIIGKRMTVVANLSRNIVARSLTHLLKLCSGATDANVIESNLRDVVRALLEAYISPTHSLAIIWENVLLQWLGSDILKANECVNRLQLLREIAVTLAQQLQNRQRSSALSQAILVLRKVTEQCLEVSVATRKWRDEDVNVKEQIFDVNNALEHLTTMYASDSAVR